MTPCFVYVVCVIVVVTNWDALRNYCKRDREEHKSNQTTGNSPSSATQLISRSNASFQGERLASSFSVCDSSSSSSGPCFSRKGVAKGEVGNTSCSCVESDRSAATPVSADSSEVLEGAPGAWGGRGEATRGGVSERPLYVERGTGEAWP